MAARLLVIMVFVVGLLAAGLGVPLALANAQASQQDLFTKRLSDTTFFASSAERPLTEADTTQLEPLLRRYDQVYGDAVLVLDADGEAGVGTCRRLDASTAQLPQLATLCAEGYTVPGVPIVDVVVRRSAFEREFLRTGGAA